MKKFKQIITQNKGVTLVEVVIYIGIVSVISAGLISIILQLVQLKTRADSIGFISSEVTNFFEKLTLDVRNCDSFVVMDSTTLQVTKDGSPSQYFLQNSKIFYNDGVNEYQLTSNLIQVTSLNFVDWTSTSSSNLLHVEIDLERGGINDQFQISVQKR